MSDSTIARHDAYMTINYGRYPIVMQRGEGCRLWDTTGKAYLDLFSGFGAGLLGHCHPDIVKAITEQAQTLWHVGNLMHTEPQTRLAQAIAKHGFDGRSYFCHAGADANEAALKLARLYGKGKRHKIISTLGSFHGRSFGTMPATGQDKVRQGFEPLTPGYTHVPYNDLPAVEKAIDPQTVVVLVEPIQGEGGIIMPTPDYLPGLRALCDQHDLLLICDEVWTGGGRTGQYFAHQHWNIVPDIMTLAKGVGGGLPVGIMCAHRRVADLFDYRVNGGVAHASTLGGNCLSMAVGAAIFEVLERDNLVARATTLGQQIYAKLKPLIGNGITEIRGKGLFLGIELPPAPGSSENAPGTPGTPGPDIVNQCMERGLLINATQNTVLRLAPPLTISDAELDEGLAILKDVICSQ